MTISHDFPFDEYDQDFYTSSDCYVLAWHLHQAFGLPMYAITAKDDWTIWSHMIVKFENDLFLDADGFLNSKEVIENHGARFDHGANAQLMPIDDVEYQELVIGQRPSIVSDQEHYSNAQALYAWAEFEFSNM